MTLSFRYKSVARPDGTLVKIPAVPVTLQGKETFDSVALLDSGADISAVPKNIAEILGLNLGGHIGLAYGLGGKVRSVDDKVQISISKGHETYSFVIPIKIILDDYDFPIILGRSGFFDNFIISFDQQEEKVWLKRKIKR